jgi:phosphohistidine phosphatase SixA
MRRLRVVLVALAVLTATASAALSQPYVVVVRHAERADGGGGMTADPPLSAAGRARARRLAAMLADLQLTAVFATEFARTQQTAAPTAAAHKLQVTTVKADDGNALVEAIRRADGSVLVVGHSNTVPEIVKRLGVATPVTVADDEYDHLFIVTPEHEVIQLRF